MRISIGGIILQVVTIIIFVVLFAEYVIRYVRKHLASKPLQTRTKPFIAFLFASTISILICCIFRIDELRDDYETPLIRNEAAFMTLEST